MHTLLQRKFLSGNFLVQPLYLKISNLIIKKHLLLINFLFSTDKFGMRYVAAYCLAALGGSSPSAKDIEKVLGSVGIDCDAESAKKVVEELNGKNLQNVIAEGKWTNFWVIENILKFLSHHPMPYGDS